MTITWIRYLTKSINLLQDFFPFLKFSKKDGFFYFFKSSKTVINHCETQIKYFVFWNLFLSDKKNENEKNMDILVNQNGFFGHLEVTDKVSARLIIPIKNKRIASTKKTLWWFV